MTKEPNCDSVSDIFDNYVIDAINDIRERKARPDDKSIHKFISKNSDINITVEDITTIIGKLLAKNVIVNNPTKEGLDSYFIVENNTNFEKEAELDCTLSNFLPETFDTLDFHRDKIVTPPTERKMEAHFSALKSLLLTKVSELKDRMKYIESTVYETKTLCCNNSCNKSIENIKKDIELLQNTMNNELQKLRSEMNELYKNKNYEARTVNKETNETEIINLLMEENQNKNNVIKLLAGNINVLAGNFQNILENKNINQNNFLTEQHPFYINNSCSNNNNTKNVTENQNNSQFVRKQSIQNLRHNQNYPHESQPFIDSTKNTESNDNSNYSGNSFVKKGNNIPNIEYNKSNLQDKIEQSNKRKTKTDHNANNDNDNNNNNNKHGNDDNNNGDSNNINNDNDNKLPTVVIMGDSMLKDINSYKLTKSVKKFKPYIKSFPGATIKCMHDYKKPSMEKSPDAVIIHIGTNDLRSTKDPTNICKEIIELAEESCSENTNVIISQIVPRGDKFNEKAKLVNNKLNEECKKRNISLISHNNIKPKIHLNSSKLHPNIRGVGLMCRNFINFLNE